MDAATVTATTDWVEPDCCPRARTSPTILIRDRARERDFGMTDAVPAARPPPESSIISELAPGSNAEVYETTALPAELRRRGFPNDSRMFRNMSATILKTVALLLGVPGHELARVRVHDGRDVEVVRLGRVPANSARASHVSGTAAFARSYGKRLVIHSSR